MSERARLPNERRASVAGGAARERILDCAESLFGAHGLEGVSLRQIGVAAGAANHSVVQYHFGSKAGLIDAIIRRRQGEFEARRAELLRAAQAQGAPSIASLLAVMFRPFAECRNGEGELAYARFMLGFLTRFQHARGVAAAEWDAGSAGMAAASLLAASLGGLAGADLVRRISWVLLMLLGALVERDGAGEAADEESFLAEIFAMMAASLAA